MISQLLHYPQQPTIATPCSALLPRHVWWAAGPFTISLLLFFQLISTLFPFLFFFTHVYQLMANLLAFLCPSVLHALMFVALGTLVFLSIPTPTVQPIPSVYRFRDYALAKTSRFFTNAARYTLVVLLPLGIQVLELVQVGAYSPIWCAYRAKSYVTRNRPSSALHYQIQKKLHLKNSSSISSLHRPYWASFHHSLALRLRHFYPHTIIQILQLHPVIISLLMAWWSHLYQRHS